MNQLLAGLIAGIIGGLVVLLMGLLQNKKNKLTGEVPIGKEWNRILMFFIFLLTGLLPLFGLILGIVGLFFKSKRMQALFLLLFTIGVIIMYVLVKSDAGRLFGILNAIFFSFYFKRYTPKSIGIAILLFIVLVISYDVLIHTRFFLNNISMPLGWERYWELRH